MPLEEEDGQILSLGDFRMELVRGRLAILSNVQLTILKSLIVL